MLKILVIEDNLHIRQILLKMLEIENFEAIGAEDGQVGVQLARKHKPDLIICDILMPKLDGYGVLTELQQDPKTALIPFIFMSALADRKDFRKGMELGADDYLTKPCRPDELLSAIASRLEKQAKYTQQEQKAPRFQHLSDTPEE